MRVAIYFFFFVEFLLFCQISRGDDIFSVYSTGASLRAEPSACLRDGYTGEGLAMVSLINHLLDTGDCQNDRIRGNE